MDFLKHKDKKLKFTTRLPNYSLGSILFRIGIHAITAYLIIQFMASLNGHVLHKEIGFLEYFKVFTYFLILSESQILFDILFEKFFPIPKKIRLRLIVQSIIGILLIIIVFQIASHFSIRQSGVPKTNVYLALAIGIVFASMFSMSLIIMRFTEKWIFHQKEIDHLKQEKLKMDYNSLQDQLNPHFLFNNLSALKSLIIYDQNAAVDFTENFTDVYRYVLQSKNKMVILVKDELEFIKAYIDLHQVRLGNGLKVNIDIHEDDMAFEIAPLTLQLLIENAIKHNITSKDSPLKIDVRIKNDYLIVENNNQKKETSYSTHTGLSNLRKRYEILTEREIVIHEDQNIFRANIPLL